MKASELIKRLEEIVKENGDVEIFRHDDEFGSHNDIGCVEKITITKRVLVEGTSWPNAEYKYVEQCSYWEIH